MIDRTFIPATIKLRKITVKILIRGLDFKIHHSDKYIILTFYIKDIFLDNTRAFVKITREIYIIDNLKADIFIEVNILTPKRIIIDFATQSIKISNYRSIIIPINSHAYSKPIKRAVKSFSKIILPPHITTLILIIYAGTLLEDKDLLFEL